LGTFDNFVGRKSEEIKDHVSEYVQLQSGTGVGKSLFLSVKQGKHLDFGGLADVGFEKLDVLALEGLEVVGDILNELLDKQNAHGVVHALPGGTDVVALNVDACGVSAAHSVAVVVEVVVVLA